jgi:hypothetical protein
MRFFNLFLRRAGLDQATALHRRRAISRLTVICPREVLGVVRKQICLDFNAVGLDVSQVQIHQGQDPEQASACITVRCPPELRAELVSQVRRLSANPAIRRVHFGAMPLAV